MRKYDSRIMAPLPELTSLGIFIFFVFFERKDRAPAIMRGEESLPPVVALSDRFG